MKIPVFHDDQHGTAIVVAAGILNGLKVVGKELGEVKLVASGAGAAALACLNQLVALGLPRSNIIVTDIKGVVYKGRKELMDPYKEPYAQETNARTLAEVIAGADVFLGLSAGGVVTTEMVASDGARIRSSSRSPTRRRRSCRRTSRRVRPDAVIASGRTDYPNQVNNVLCFPFVFRGALDVGATTINEEMKKAAVVALARIAESEAVRHRALRLRHRQHLCSAPTTFCPKPFDPRLIIEIAPAVAKAAMDSGVATRPIADFDAYRQQAVGLRLPLRLPDEADLRCRPQRHARAPKRIVFAEGEHPYVLQAAQRVIAEGIARPLLIGRRDNITRMLTHLGLRMRAGIRTTSCSISTTIRACHALDGVPTAGRAARRLAEPCRPRGALRLHGAGRPAAEARRCRRHDLRRGRPLSHATAPRLRGDRQARRRARLRHRVRR